MFKQLFQILPASSALVLATVALECLALEPEVPAGAPAAGGENAAHERLWSLEPLQASEPPPVNDADWPQRRIDDYLLAALEERGLSPSAAADRRTLARRVYFDLTGLPPTPEQLEQFLQDDSPQAVERLVDRLLASPHYGERWARFWLDLARYTDTTASWLERSSHPYLYRDWVVRAFNDDLPYDQFIKRQLATDLMPDTPPADMPALGFLGLSPTYWKELRLDVDVIKTVVAEEWEERIDTIGRTFLGLTIACARCHDHKFDPISTADYYALAGVLASTRLADRSMLPEPQAEAVAEAKARVAKLQEQATELEKQKPVPEDLAGQLEAIQLQVAEIRESTPGYDVPLAPGVEEASLHVLPDGPDMTKLVYKKGEPQDLAIQMRGNPASTGPVVPRRFVASLSQTDPEPFREGSGRLELAEALVNDSRDLVARVIVNRIWLEHFGRGLVDTPSNFGQQGARPSHPALLDDLAARFIRSGWSIKWLHREIVLSAAYQQSSSHRERAYAVDPENRWLWRMNRRRLTIESWRDAMLAASGELDLQLGGPSQDLESPENRRRTLYGTINRRELTDMLRMFDFPDPNTHGERREPTTTPLQQLFVLNSDFMRQRADALARRVLDQHPEDLERQIVSAYQLLYAGEPTDRQLQLGLAYLQDTSVATELDARWRQYAQALLAGNQFLFVD